MNELKILKNQNLINTLKNYYIKFDSENNMINLNHIGSGLYSKVFEINDTNLILNINHDIINLRSAIFLLLEKNNLNDLFLIPKLIAPINKEFLSLNELNKKFNLNLNEQEYEIYNEKTFLDQYDENYNFISNTKYYFIYEKCYKLNKLYENLYYNFIDEYNYEDISQDLFLVEHINEYKNNKNIDELKFIDFINKVNKISNDYYLADIHIDNIMLDSNNNFKVIDFDYIIKNKNIDNLIKNYI